MHAAARGSVGVRHRVQDLGRLDQPGEQRGLPDRELLRIGLAEVPLGRRLDAVSTVPEVDDVQVALEDLVLRHLVLEPDREHGLADLRLEVALLGVSHRVLDELLGDGRPALLDLARVEVLEQRARRALVVDATVLVEAAVLDREHRVDQVLGHVREGDRLAILLGEEGGHEGAGAVEHVRPLRLLVHLRQEGPVGGRLREFGARRDEQREAAGEGSTPDGDDHDEHDEKPDDLHDCYKLGTAVCRFRVRRTPPGPVLTGSGAPRRRILGPRRSRQRGRCRRS